MTTTAQSPFLDLRGLAAPAHMRFTTRQHIEGAYSGSHRSRTQGGAGEFVDYREYSDGEDLRRLDWKVLARSGRAYVRLFQDETNLLCTLAIDVSNSMRFGEVARSRWRQSKLEYTQYLTTALSHVIGRGQDQVGLALVGGSLGECLAPGGTRAHVSHLQSVIARLQTEACPRMALALNQLFERVSRRGVLVFVSDFLSDDLEEVFAALRLFRHSHWEVLTLHVVHPDEERLPEGVAYRFVGMERDETLDCTPAEIRRDYEGRFAAHLATVRGLALSSGCDYRLLSTAIPYLQTLRGFLVERAG